MAAEVSKSEFLTTGQAAKVCSVTPDTILKWLKKGRLNGVRTAGGHYRIQRQDLEPLVASPNPAESHPRQLPASHPRSVRCWEYLGERGAIRDDCRDCVVYRVRAARCFKMAGMEADIGHVRQFCRGSCEDCVYYRRVNGLATNVLVISSDEELVDLLAGEEDESVTLRFARNPYEASAAMCEFRPAFAAIDVECIPTGGEEFFDCLAGDPRIPGLKIILVAPVGRRRRLPRSDLVVGVLEKPFGTGRLAATINSYPLGLPTREGNL